MRSSQVSFAIIPCNNIKKAISCDCCSSAKHIWFRAVTADNKRAIWVCCSSKTQSSSRFKVVSTSVQPVLKYNLGRAWNIQKYLKHRVLRPRVTHYSSINITSRLLKPSVFPAMQSYWVPPASPGRALTKDAPWQRRQRRRKFHQPTEFLQVKKPPGVVVFARLGATKKTRAKRVTDLKNGTLIDWLMKNVVWRTVSLLLSY